MTSRQTAETALYRMLLDFFAINYAEFNASPRFASWFASFEQNVAELERYVSVQMWTPQESSSTRLEAEEQMYEVAFGIRRVLTMFAERLGLDAQSAGQYHSTPKAKGSLGVELFLVTAYILQELQPILHFLSYCSDREAAEQGIQAAIQDLTSGANEGDPALSERERLRAHIRAVLAESKELLHDTVLHDPHVFARLDATLRVSEVA
ncbi:MAG: hypothetical protein HY962_01660 [Ignavibacteriae bacterium]|nr:hypothetical protein [Ignavibacteriota bacterium]